MSALSGRLVNAPGRFYASVEGAQGMFQDRGHAESAKGYGALCSKQSSPTSQVYLAVFIK